MSQYLFIYLFNLSLSGILFQYKVLVSQEVQIGETFYTNQILHSTFKFIQTHIKEVTTDMNWEPVPDSSSSILECSFASSNIPWLYDQDISRLTPGTFVMS